MLNNTVCENNILVLDNGFHIRKEDYDVFFKAEDFPPVTSAGVSNLVDSKIWKIRVLAPAVKNVTATAGTGTQIIVNWSAYNCALPNATLILYRKHKKKSCVLDPIA